MKLRRNTKLNGVSYKIPDMNLVFDSFHMNMTAEEYIRRSYFICKSLLDEDWIFVKKGPINNLHTVFLYKCKNGTILTLDQKLKQ
jgi:hypothetical protein